MSTSHIVELPFFVTIIRIAQLVLTIIILGLAGNTINGLTGGSGATFGLEPLGFTIFCCVWTLLVNAYLLATPIFLPVAYNMWGHLALEALSWLFWLSGFASTASWASARSGWGNDSFLGYPSSYKSYWATAAAAAGMGAIMWILYTVTLVFFCLRLHSHRTDPNNAHLSSLGLAEKGGEGHQMGAVQHQQQQQVVYPPSEAAPTPVQQYVATPPPQQWQQSPPPAQGQPGQY